MKTDHPVMPRARRSKPRVFLLLVLSLAIVGVVALPGQASAAPPSWCASIPPAYRPPACNEGGPTTTAAPTTTTTRVTTTTRPGATTTTTRVPTTTTTRAPTTTTTQPGGGAFPIEAKYRARGTWAVTTGAANDAAGRAYTIFRPTNLGADGVKHPIITWGNGTGSTPSNYTATLTSLASWGFVVVASDSGTTGYGQEVWGAAQHMISQNNVAASVFYQKLNTAKVGSTGHSQGATGSVNAAIQSNGVISSTATVEFVDPAFFSDASQMPDWSKVTKPVFLISATGDFLSSQGAQATYYSKLTGPAAKAALKGGDHNVIQQANNAQLGYLTAWFAYTLQGDPTARQAFVGAPEINANTNWTNQVEKGLL